jgi:hypothetical protein
VHSPAHIGGKLRGLGTRQQHAEIQSIEVARLVDPFALLHLLAVHERDLAGWAAKERKPILAHTRSASANVGRASAPPGVVETVISVVEGMMRPPHERGKGRDIWAVASRGNRDQPLAPKISANGVDVKGCSGA